MKKHENNLYVRLEGLKKNDMRKIFGDEFNFHLSCFWTYTLETRW
ncbi:hypothetical protein [Chryseobacterium sp. R2ACT005]